MKWILFLIAAVLAAVGVIAVAASFTGGVPVETAVVSRGEIRQFVDERGTTRLRETHLVTMPFAARIEKLTLEVGDKVVVAGQVKLFDGAPVKVEKTLPPPQPASQTKG